MTILYFIWHIMPKFHEIFSTYATVCSTQNEHTEVIARRINGLRGKQETHARACICRCPCAVEVCAALFGVSTHDTRWWLAAMKQNGSLQSALPATSANVRSSLFGVNQGVVKKENYSYYFYDSLASSTTCSWCGVPCFLQKYVEYDKRMRIFPTIFSILQKMPMEICEHMRKGIWSGPNRHEGYQVCMGNAR